MLTVPYHAPYVNEAYVRQALRLLKGEKNE